jgi:DNA-binding MarR family transcriptional regulator
MVDRLGLETQVGYDLRALNADTNRLERLFATLHNVSNNDLDALRHIIVSETAGTPLSSGDLRERLGVSAAAVTYLVDRMIEGGHVRRDSDPTDRRRVILRYSEHGSQVAQAFFRPMRAHTHAAMAEFSDEELGTAHRVLVAMSGAMHSYYDEVVAQHAE